MGEGGSRDVKEVKAEIQMQLKVSVTPETCISASIYFLKYFGLIVWFSFRLMACLIHFLLVCSLFMFDYVFVPICVYLT